MWTRRAFLKSSGLALFSVSIGGTPLFLSRAANAAASADSYRRKVLVTIFQRGAMDGLMAVTPFNDPMLPKLRPRLALTAAKSAGDAALIDLDGTFGLHPGFAPIRPLFEEKRLAIVHGVGSPNPTRSHFDAQDYMETGTPGHKGTRSGWLNRAVGLLGHEATPFRAVAMTKGMPRALSGDKPALAINNLANFGVKVPGNKRASQGVEKIFKSLYENTSEEHLRRAGHDSFEAIKMLSEIEVENYRPANGAKYPSNGLGNSLRQIAQLIKAGVGLEVAFAESGGWDTHVQQGTITGPFARRVGNLAQCIGAFWTDIEGYHDEVVLMTMTEFGRSVHENGSGGTDHGRGSCLFVLGNRVDGGKVHGTVPPLVAESLDKRRDLPVTTDFRAVFAEVAGAHLDIDDNQALFPGWTGERLPLIK